MMTPSSPRYVSKPSAFVRNALCGVPDSAVSCVVLWLVVVTCLLSATTCFAQATATDARPAASADADAKFIEESWSILTIQGTRVGHEHSTLREATQDGQPVLLGETQMFLVIKRFNMTMQMHVRISTTEDEQGNLRAIGFQLENPPNSRMSADGKVEQGTLTLITKAGEKQDTLKIDLPAKTKSPLSMGRLLESHQWKTGETVEIKAFDPQFNKIDTITMTAGDPVETETFDGSKAMLTPVVSTHSLIPVLRETAYLNAEGTVVKTDVNLLQTVAWRVSKEEALKKLSGEELDLAINTLVHVGPIRNAARTREVVYEMTAGQANLIKLLPTGETQQVNSIGSNAVELTVTSLRPADLVSSQEATAEDLAEYLRASPFLDWKDPDVARHAKIAAAEFDNPIDLAVAMEGYVSRELKAKGFSTSLATAAEVADSLAGDCTEHAVLLAAMLRARQIPSRVAIGLVYSNAHGAFAGHMWTEANLHGHWVPLDATLGRGGIGATHIKFADSSMSDNAPMPSESFATFTFLLDSMTIKVKKVSH